MRKTYKIVFMGSDQAGMIGLLTLLALKHQVELVVAYNDMVAEIAESFSIPVILSIKQPSLERILGHCDLLVSVHGKEIVPQELLSLPKFGGINVHPCLFKYRGKGTHPITELIRDGGTIANVAVHKMIEEVDAGEVLNETYIDVGGLKTPAEIYNRLYRYYSVSLIKALEGIWMTKKL